MESLNRLLSFVDSSGSLSSPVGRYLLAIALVDGPVDCSDQVLSLSKEWSYWGRSDRNLGLWNAFRDYRGQVLEYFSDTIGTRDEAIAATFFVLGFASRDELADAVAELRRYPK